MYDAGLAERLDEIMAGMLEMEVTHMFGGYGFLMNGHMCAGIWNDMLVIRIGTDGLRPGGSRAAVSVRRLVIRFRLTRPHPQQTETQHQKSSIHGILEAEVGALSVALVGVIHSRRGLRFLEAW